MKTNVSKVNFKKESHFNIAKNAIKKEIYGIQSLYNNLNEETFLHAIRIIQNTKQRLIVTGMGKSGHIAKKIVATLSSTGQPSMFVHPAEASHGDLGMITSEDSVLILSNGGESDELISMISYCKRFSVPIISMTKKHTSTLAKNSDCVLIIPDCEEACPLNLAPTTSTTQMLALGDAISAVLLEDKGFNDQNFKTFHPGGKLGKQLLTVDSCMHDSNDLPVIDCGESKEKIINCMSRKKFGCIGILNSNGELKGMLTDGDIRRWLEKNTNSNDFNIEEVMNKTPTTITPKTLMGEALSIMNKKGITSLFVCNEGSKCPIGILHIHDILKNGIV